MGVTEWLLDGQLHRRVRGAPDSGPVRRCRQTTRSPAGDEVSRRIGRQTGDVADLVSADEGAGRRGSR